MEDRNYPPLNACSIPTPLNMELGEGCVPGDLHFWQPIFPFNGKDKLNGMGSRTPPRQVGIWFVSTKHASACALLHPGGHAAQRALQGPSSVPVYPFSVDGRSPAPLHGKPLFVWYLGGSNRKPGFLHGGAKCISQPSTVWREPKPSATHGADKQSSWRTRPFVFWPAGPFLWGAKLAPIVSRRRGGAPKLVTTLMLTGLSSFFGGPP